MGRTLIERNFIELKIPAGAEAPRAVLLGTISGAAPSAANAEPPYLTGDFLCRNNLIRNVGGVNSPSYNTRALSIDGAQNLLLNGNVIDILSGATDPISGRPEQIWHQNCTAPTFFNNTQATGKLWVGYNQKTQIENQELETDTELALIIGLLEK